MARRGRQRGGRAVDGVLLLDKPVGQSSNAVLQAVKRLFRARKAGHTGSLDPLASGMLPICFGRATKISSFLLESDKGYRVEARLGVCTETGDAEGRVIHRHTGRIAFSRARVVEVLAEFLGEIEQIPPMYSAVKVDGRPLYELARQGIEIERRPRTVRIHELELLALDGDRLEVEVRCSKGTYVRTLIEDIGRSLGCGAYVTALRRTTVAGFDPGAMVTFDELEELADLGFEALDARLIGLGEALSHWPGVRLGRQSAYFLRQGQPVQVPSAPSEGWVRIYETGRDDGAGERFLGVGHILDDGRVAPRRLVVGG